MMFKPLLLLTVAALATGASMRPDTAFVGQKVLRFSLETPLEDLDVSKVQVQGHEVANALFIEELDPQLYLQERTDLLDLTERADLKLVSWERDDDGVRARVESDAPWKPVQGWVLSDTAFGGVAGRILGSQRVDPGGMVTRGSRQTWELTLRPLSLGEVVPNCDLRFVTRMDLDWVIKGERWREELRDESQEGGNGRGYPMAQMNLELEKARIFLQPIVEGRLRIVQGRIEILDIQMRGDLEAEVRWHGKISRSGEFHWSRKLPHGQKRMLPIAPGIHLDLNQQLQVHFSAHAFSPGMEASVTYSVSNRFRHGARHADGKWQPESEHGFHFSAPAPGSWEGVGEMLFAVRPIIHASVSGEREVGMEMNPYSTLKMQPPPQSSTLLSGGAHLLVGGQVWLHAGSRDQEPGSDIQNRLIYSREELLYAPPQTDADLKVTGKSGNVVELVWWPVANSDRYIVQHKREGGKWESHTDTVRETSLSISNLRPQVAYRFRVFPANAVGVGFPFPEEGVLYRSKGANLPPYPPEAITPRDGLSGVPVPATIRWRSHDPDLDNELRYTLRVDTEYPPSAVRVRNTPDTVAQLDLEPGTDYYWQVQVHDGKDTVVSPVWHFRTQEKPPGPVATWLERDDLAFIPAGTYRRGDGREIRLGAFYLQRYEVIQSDFERAMGRNPSYRLGDSLPVERVTWEEAVTYCRSIKGRLPTEAEWEYAARAESRSRFSWGNGNPDEFAWYRANSGQQTHRVGRKKPNEWGLYDMNGNVFEWVSDWYAGYEERAWATSDPAGPADGGAKVIRGASWYSDLPNLAVDARFSMKPGMRSYKLGFRCAVDVSGDAFRSDVAEDSELAGTALPTR